MSATPPRLSVVVPVRDDPQRLRQCLAALAASTIDPAAYEIVVVDDASRSPESADVAEASGAHVIRLPDNVGPAVARNSGARAARGDIVWFVDADCLAHADAMARVLVTLGPDTSHDATFGSYGPAPASPALISRWKNLAHRHTHQVARPDASTFWSGCGAMRRDVFLKFGGFDETYGRPCIEDVELGMRLSAAGHDIRLDRDLQVEHLKRWRWGGLVRTDVFDRGVPWTRVLLAAARDGGASVPDLNVGPTQKIAALAAAALVGLFVVAGFFDPWLWLVPLVAVVGTLALDALTARGVGWRWLTPIVLLTWAGVAVFITVRLWPVAIIVAGLIGAIVLLNRRQYAMMARIGGVGFAVAGFVPHVVYYLCALAGYAIGVVSHLVRPRPAPAAPTAATAGTA